jgi:hypothetical protein
MMPFNHQLVYESLVGWNPYEIPRLKGGALQTALFNEMQFFDMMGAQQYRSFIVPSFSFVLLFNRYVQVGEN